MKLIQDLARWRRYQRRAVAVTHAPTQIEEPTAALDPLVTLLWVSTVLGASLLFIYSVLLCIFLLVLHLVRSEV